MVHQVASEMTPSVSYVETMMVAGSNDSWIVDSGATNHVCNSLHGFQITRKLRQGELELMVGDGAKVWARAEGTIVVVFDG